ncbi:GTP pyrophosphokinase [Burkholderia gladioli]|uniref:GTP pyrophosphokinase n=1 Tax=Burkholderia gladioli TaxID=28095 RepID=UPI001640FBF3|nr:hypothetical protein [Burkholderia gladioli]
MSTQNKYLHDQYISARSDATRFKDALLAQISHLLAEKQISTGVPLEARVKDWDSIQSKLNRKEYYLPSIQDLDDLIGVRIILLFLRDLDEVDKTIRSTFDVIQAEDTSARLSDAQFGYNSRHFIVRIPDAWQGVPTFSGLKKFKLEIQIRTLAQHIWAAASHKLQYKQEENVPPQLRRAIYRASAILETVDLEFERFLIDRKKYIEENLPKIDSNEPPNVDIIAALLDETFPSKNKLENEPYDELMQDLSFLKIKTAKSFKDILTKHHDAVMRDEINQMAYIKSSHDYTGTTQDRADMGVFYTHIGLARCALSKEFGDDTSVRLYEHRNGAISKNSKARH